MSLDNPKIYKLRKEKQNIEYNGNNTLENEFANMVSNRGTALSPITCKSYISKINRISIMMNGKPYENYNFLLDADKIVDAVKKSNLKSKKDYLSACSKLLRHKKVSSEILEKYNNGMKTEKANETQERGNNVAKPNDIKKTGGKSLKQMQTEISNYDIIENNNIDSNRLINKLLVSFYLMNFNHEGLPNFIPRNDLPEFKIISVNRTKKQLTPDFNYLVVDDNKRPTKIIMKNYKTKGTYGTQSFRISAILTTLLEEYIRHFGKSNGDFLFTDKNGKPFKNNNFASLIENAMNTILGSRIGIDLARQIVITNIYNDNPIMTINEKKEVARAFLHSSNMASEYIRPDLMPKK